MSATGGVLTSKELAQLRARWENATDGAVYRTDLPVDVLAGMFSAAPADVAALLAHADALAEALARAAPAPLADDYPAAVFRELWRVLQELRAGTGEEGRA